MMMDIYEMQGGKPVKTDEIKDDVWINLVNPTAEEIDTVQAALQIDREALTAALDDEEGSRTEVSQKYTLILVDAPAREWRNNREEFTTYPLSITITDTAIVTVSLLEMFALTNITAGKNKNINTVNVANRTRFVLQILFRVAMNYQADLKYIEVKRMAIEESIRKATRRDDLFELHELESNLVYFKTSLSVNCSVIDRIGKLSRFVSSPEDRDLMDDVIIETNQALEMTMTYSQIIKGTRQLVEDHHEVPDLHHADHSHTHAGGQLLRDERGAARRRLSLYIHRASGGHGCHMHPRDLASAEARHVALKE